MGKKNAQEPATPGPGNLLWEDESPKHWDLKINRAAHQGGLECCGVAKSLLTEKCVLPISETQHRQ